MIRQRVIAFDRELVAKNLHLRNAGSRHHQDEMDAFTKQVQFLDHTRRYSIAVTGDGWEVREERDSEVVRQTHYHDWHRVERVQRSIANELNDLQAQGWVVVR